MGSSPGFGSTACDSQDNLDDCPSALFGLAFAAARRVSRLTLPHTVTRWVILQEARPEASQPLLAGIARGLLVGTRFQVLFHSPRRGAFHLSLTVLVHYRSPRVFSLTEWTP